MIDLTGKSALVLGGSRGIGAATALRLAEQGANVAITYAHSADRAGAVVDSMIAVGRKAIAIEADASQRGANTKAAEEAAHTFGKVDILVASAGTFDTGPITELDDARFDASFDVHVRSVFEAVRATLQHMGPGGSIITIGSIFGDVAPFPGLSLYMASKAAEAGLAKALAREVGATGITANCIQPGPINTEMNPGDPAMNPMAETQIGQTALGRYGTPEDIAALVAFLASDHGRFITGQTINVDGGWTA